MSASQARDAYDNLMLSRRSEELRGRVGALRVFTGGVVEVAQLLEQTRPIRQDGAPNLGALAIAGNEDDAIPSFSPDDEDGETIVRGLD